MLHPHWLSDGDKYQIIMEKVADEAKDGKLYSTMPPNGGDIYVVYYEGHPQGKHLEKALDFKIFARLTEYRNSLHQYQWSSTNFEQEYTTSS